jgi:hypothetical protein
MADSPLRAKGRAMRRKLMGDAYADKLDKGLYADPFMEKFAEITQEAIFGTVWTRPGLDLKTRTLICVISDAATGRMPELKLHIRFAQPRLDRGRARGIDPAPDRLCRGAAGSRGAAHRQGSVRGNACRTRLNRFTPAALRADAK